MFKSKNHLFVIQGMHESLFFRNQIFTETNGRLSVEDKDLCTIVLKNINLRPLIYCLAFYCNHIINTITSRKYYPMLPSKLKIRSLIKLHSQEIL